VKVRNFFAYIFGAKVQFVGWPIDSLESQQHLTRVLT
jgi:hypothetical protein